MMAQKMVAWVVKSFDNMTIEGESVYSGLFTGWRCTSWINTVLNHVYMMCAKRSFERLNGYNPIIDFDGTGDDVDTSISSVKDACRFYHVMLKMGYEDNAIKQLVTKGPHEFMRCIYIEDKVYNCLNRALPGFICGDLERTGADAAQRLMSGFINIGMLVRRGLSSKLGKALEKCVIKRWGRFKHKEVYENISKCVIHASREQGGMGVPDEDGNLWVLEQSIPTPRKEAIKMKATKWDMTRDGVLDSLRELTELGIENEYNEEKVREMAVDSYSFDDINRALVGALDNDEFINYWTFNAKVTGKSEVKQKTDYSLLGQFLREASMGDMDKVLKIVEKYDRLSVLLPFTKVSKGKLETMVDDNGYALVDASDLTLDIRNAIRCPDWATSTITRYTKYKVAVREWDASQAKDLGCILLNTYAELYQHKM
jgi:hypothetical protein